MSVRVLLAAWACVVVAASVPSLADLAGSLINVTSCWVAARRTGAGFPGITPQQCADAGHCFDSSAATEWCFLPQDGPDAWAPTPAFPSAPGRVNRYAGSQAAPSVASPLGAAKAAVSGGVAGVTCWSVPPLAQECDALGDGGLSLGWPLNLVLDGGVPAAGLAFQASPFEVTRWASVGPGAPAGSGGTVRTALRLAAHSPLALLSVNVTGGGGSNSGVAVTLQLPMLVADMGGVWSWGRPAPAPTPAAWTVSLAGGVAVSLHAASGAAGASGVWAPGATLAWDIVRVGGGDVAALNITWPPGSSSGVSFGLVLAIARGGSGGGGAAAAASAAATAAADFPSVWAAARDDAEHAWAAAFTSGNDVFSGSLPTLPWPPAPAPAPAALSRAYYGGVASLLAMLRNVSALGGGRTWSLPTAAPVWAVSDSYLWDTSMVATLMALLEPVGWARIVADLLSFDSHEHYALDYLSNQGVGPRYSFNDLSIFTLLDKTGTAGDVVRRATSALRRADSPSPAPSLKRTPRAPPDVAYYNSSVAGKRVIDWMDSAATYWISLVPPAAALADYGGASNLLECVPTYIHRVPSLNAANVAMMTRAAGIWSALGNSTRAAELTARASALLPHVRSLYIAGTGVWACEQSDGSHVPVRTVIDFIHIADALGGAAQLLDAPTCAEMRAFAARELLVPGWLRALSLNDTAAAASDRADHGPLGAYDAWVPRAAVAFAELGDAPAGVALLAEAAETALAEGLLGQAHRVLTGSGQVIKEGSPAGGGQDYFEAAGAAFAEGALRLVAGDW